MSQISTGKDSEAVASQVHRVKCTQKWKVDILGNSGLERESPHILGSCKRPLQIHVFWILGS